MSERSQTTTGQEMFYVRFQTVSGVPCATSIQCCLPKGLNFYQAKEYLIGRIVTELGNYALQECLSHEGITP